jgi:protein-S-isoprenylcysteine O-methyltransferase Ste14
VDREGSHPSAESEKRPTGSLKPGTGALAAAPEPTRWSTRIFTRDLLLRLAELAIFLTAMIGAVALGLGITDYFHDHRYVAAYLLAYAGFRLADLLVRDEGEDVRRDSLAPRILGQMPLLVLFAAAPFERTYGYGGEAPAWAAALGLLLELAGLWLALGARIQLHFFSSDRAGREGAQLVRSGFYKYVRHPIYSGMFLVLFAWPFEYGAPVTALFTLVIGAFVLHRQIRGEELLLRERYGPEYADYCRETDALIPSIW